MSRTRVVSPSLSDFLIALFERASARTLVELRWPVPDGMHRRFYRVDQLRELEEHARGLAVKLDVYFGVLPRWRHSGRRRDLAGSPRVIWADCDSPASAEALARFEPPPSLVLCSGSGENRHAFWLLSRAETLWRIEDANRRLASSLGADGGVVTAPGAILRLPETLNHKHSPPTPVSVVLWEPYRRYRLEQITCLLPADPSAAVVMAHRRAGRAPVLGLAPEFYVWRLTGRRPGPSRKIHCPFHDDRHPSLHVYREPHRGWFCYGCRRGGSEIDFAALLWGMSTKGADFLALCAKLEHMLLS